MGSCMGKLSSSEERSIKIARKNMEKREKEFQKSSKDFLKQVTKISNKGQFATDADFHKCKNMFKKSETNFDNLASDFDNIMDIHNDKLEQISTIMFRGSYSDSESESEYMEFTI